MSAILLVYTLFISAIIAFVSGIYLIGGLGTALIALAISLIALGSILHRGIEHGE